jgi:DNA-directed RNA polymerase subunit beta'
MGGPRNPHDILDVRGEEELQKYLVNEIQEVWRLQGVNINDRHLEAISGQMMRWVRVEDIGDPPPIQSSKTSDQLYIDGHILVS